MKGQAEIISLKFFIVLLFAATGLTDNCTTSTFVHNNHFIQLFTNSAVQSIDQ